MDKVKCISYNVRGLNSYEKRVKLYDYEFRSYFIKMFNMSCLVVINLLTVDVSWLISK